MSKQKLFVLLGTMHEVKDFTRVIVSDCINEKSEEWAKGYVAGFNVSFMRNPDDLFNPDNYQADDPKQYEAGHREGQRRGHQFQGIFLGGLSSAGIIKPAANNNQQKEA